MAFIGNKETGKAKMKNLFFSIIRGLVFWAGAAFLCEMLLRVSPMAASLGMGLIVAIMGYCFFELVEDKK
jgi:hypothetical protein